MRKLISILVAALFAAVTFSAYAADPAPAKDPSTTTKPPAKKKKSSKPAPTNGTVQQGTPQTSGRGDPPTSARRCRRRSVVATTALTSGSIVRCPLSVMRDA